MPGTEKETASITHPPHNKLTVASRAHQPLIANLATAPSDEADPNSWDAEKFLELFNKHFAKVNKQTDCAFKLKKNLKNANLFNLANGDDAVGSIKYNPKNNTIALNYGKPDHPLAAGFTNLDLLVQSIKYASDNGYVLTSIGDCPADVTEKLIEKLRQANVDLSELKIMGPYGKFVNAIPEATKEPEKIIEQENLPENDDATELDMDGEDAFDDEEDNSIRIGPGLVK